MAGIPTAAGLTEAMGAAEIETLLQTIAESVSLQDLQAALQEVHQGTGIIPEVPGEVLDALREFGLLQRSGQDSGDR